MVNRLCFYTTTYSKSHHSGLSLQQHRNQLLSVLELPEVQQLICSEPQGLVQLSSATQIIHIQCSHCAQVLPYCLWLCHSTLLKPQPSAEGDNSPKTAAASTLKVRQKRLHPQMGKIKGCQMLASGSVTSRCCSTAIDCGKKKTSCLRFNYKGQLDT